MRKDERKKLTDMHNEWEVSHLLAEKINDIEEILKHFEENTNLDVSCFVPFRRIKAYTLLLGNERELMHRIIEETNIKRANIEANQQKAQEV